MKTAVVILNWNTENFLKEFLPGLISSVQKCSGAEVIVADNASTDGSMKLMKEMFPQIRTISFDRNHGFTGGYNRAFNEIESDLFVLINSDIEITENWLQPLIGWMESHPDCGACAPKLHSWQNRGMFEYAGAAGGYIDRFGYPFCRGRVLKRLDRDNGQYDTPEDVFWATGACLMVRSSLYKELGGLDDRFFAHMEEIDLCWRMQLAGYKVTVVPEATVYHVGGGTLPSTSPFKLYLNYRNNLWMLSNNLAKTYALRLYKNGLNLNKAAAKARTKAELTIGFRMFLDWMSAGVYLLTLKWECFKAVYRAHKDYRHDKRKLGTDEISDFLKNAGKEVSVRGIYGRWIILRALLKGNSIFKSINEKDFKVY